MKSAEVAFKRCRLRSSAGPSSIGARIVFEGRVLAERPLFAVAADIDGTISKSNALSQFFGSFGKLGLSERMHRARANSDIKLALNLIAKQNHGIPLERFSDIARLADFFDAVPEFFDNVQKASGRVALVSAAYEPIAQAVARKAGIQEAIVCATRVKIRGNRVTGFLGPVMFGEVKASAVQEVSDELGVPLSRFVGLGDSESDAYFLRLISDSQGLAIAVSSKQQLVEKAKPSIVMDKPDYAKIWGAVKTKFQL